METQPNHLVCLVCPQVTIKAVDYHKHVRSEKHANHITANKKMYSMIDEVIEEFDLILGSNKVIVVKHDEKAQTVEVN